jgi:hypothetical protein
VLISPFILGLEFIEIWTTYIPLSLIALLIGFFTFYQIKSENFKTLIWSNVMIILMVTLVGQSGIEFFKKNTDFKSLSYLSLENQNLPTYYYKGLPPEVIWEYGNNITPFSRSNIPVAPFRLLISENDLKTFISEHPTLLNQSVHEVFDRIYFREGERKHARFKTYVYEIFKLP